MPLSEIKLKNAKAAYEAKDYSLAMSHYNLILDDLRAESSSDNYRKIWCIWANCCLKLESTHMLNEVIAFHLLPDPTHQNSSPVQLIVAKCHLRLNEFEQACLSLESFSDHSRANLAAKDLLESQALMSTSLIKRGQISQAISTLESAIADLNKLNRSLTELEMEYFLEFHHHLANAYTHLNRIEDAVNVLARAKSAKNAFDLDHSTILNTKMDTQYFLILLDLFDGYVATEKTALAKSLFDLIGFHPFTHYAETLPSQEKAIACWMKYIELQLKVDGIGAALGSFNNFVKWITSHQLDAKYPDLYCLFCLLGANLYLQGNNLKPLLAIRFISAACNVETSLSEENKNIIRAKVTLFALIAAFHSDVDLAVATLEQLVQFYTSLKPSEQSEVTQLIAQSMSLLPKNVTQELKLIKDQLEHLKPDASQDQLSVSATFLPQMQLSREQDNNPAAKQSSPSRVYKA